MIEESRVFKLAPTTTLQRLGEGEGAVILELDTGQLHTCNDTTASFLSYVDGSRTFSALVDALEIEYEVDRMRLSADLSEISKQLLEKGLIV